MQPSTSKLEVRKATGVKLENEETSMLYKLLMNKRMELAAQYNCMPYMVASNEALMNIAIMKPFNLKQLKECRCKFVFCIFYYYLDEITF